MRAIITRLSPRVYEEEGYEDSGYDHGGYKKHGESEVDTNNHSFNDDYVPKQLKESSVDDTLKDHESHLEAIQENDPSGESSSNKSVQNNENPNVKVSWKQEKTTSNERSMAFLDDRGKGGILTQKHPTKTEGVIGKYLNTEKKYNPVITESNRDPGTITGHNRPVSFQRFASFQNANPYSNDYTDLSSKYDWTTSKPNTVKFNYYQKNWNGNKNPFPTDIGRQIGNDGITSDAGSSQTSIPLTRLVDKRMRSSPSSSNSKINNTPLNPHLRNTKPPQKYQSDTKNEPISQNYNTYISGRNVHYRNLHKPDLNDGQSIGEFSKGISDYPSNKNKHSSRFTNLRPSENEKYSEESISVYSLDTQPSSKERRSRDLTAFGVDGREFISQSDFTHPTQALRAIEEQLSSISTRRSGGTPTTRPISKSGEEPSGRKYKEIVRDSSQSQEEVTTSRGERLLRVKLKKDDLNSRHPFLPIDGDRDVQIDYVQTRTRVQPDTDLTERRHHYNRDDVDIPPVTEQPVITTTPKHTTVTSPTTTEYTPEDPAQTLGRLRSNVFLSSVFSSQENKEEESYQADKQSTTTPKITTYRAKTTTEEEGLVKETPEETFERLKSNPFLTAIFLNKNDSAETDERKPLKRRGRTRPIVVLPDDSDIATDSSVKHVEQLTLAHYSGPSNGLLYKQVPTTTQHRISNLAKHLNREGVEPMHIVIRRSVDSQYEQQGDIGTTTEMSVDLEKYPFYYSPTSVNLPKYSPLRYATNPKDIPIKRNNRMNFYESRDKAVKCDEPSPPKNIIPKRHKDGEWNKKPEVVGQRLGKLGDQIDCLKMKYFGIDPLDSPFFKEKEIEAVNTAKHPTNEDRYGLYFDVVQNIKSNFQSESRIQSDSNVNANLFPTPKINDRLKTASYFQHVPGKKGSDLDINKYNSSYQNKDPVVFEESRIILKPLIKRENRKEMSSNSQNKSNPFTPISEKSNISYSTSTSDSTTIYGDQIRTKHDLTQLHSPKNVFISLRSKGTSNHPRIGVIKRASSPYNLNIKVVPMSTVGYLKSHPPLHISLKHALNFNNNSNSSGELINKLESISSQVSKVTKRKKFPEGRIKHDLTGTFVSIKSDISDSKSEPYSDKPSIKEVNIEPLPNNESSRKPKYRVKRNHENDKYINSKESLELKNLLFQKYSEILAKEHSEASAKGNSGERNTSEKALARKNISTTTSRNIGGFFNRGNHPYSSRYSAVQESPDTSSDVKDAKVNKFSVKNPIRNEKLRFPKLNMNTRTVSDSSRTKISSSPDPITLRMSTTTTSTTTEEPPTTTTRMYKPRVIYKKEYGKPLDKVVNIFAVLNRQPPSSMEKEITTSTEYIDDIRSSTPETTSKPIKRLKPKRLQQFERRRFTKEEVVRETYTPVSEITERSDKIDAIYDHPDLRGPVSRISRGTPDEYDEMLVYIVNPRTGIGEWKMLPVATKTISRMDDDIRDYLQNHGNILRQSKTRKQTSKDNVEHVKHSRLKPVEDKYGEMAYKPNTGNAPDGNSGTESDPKISRSKSRRKHTSRTHKNKMYLNSSELRTMPPPASEAALEYATPEYETPEYATSEHVNPTEILPTSTFSYTTFRPKIIRDPQKRRYFYAKI
ncbi:hypothetical protein J6590_061960 [Homalodisca vitripennis]|nr:hypothetical protein J6590_061960 [Homalodisca vitripennis]